MKKMNLMPLSYLNRLCVTFPIFLFIRIPSSIFSNWELFEFLPLVFRPLVYSTTDYTWVVLSFENWNLLLILLSSNYKQLAICRVSSVMWRLCLPKNDKEFIYLLYIN